MRNDRVLIPFLHVVHDAKCFFALCILAFLSTTIGQVIDKGYFFEAFLFKPRGGRSPPSGLNRKPRKNPLSSL